MNGQNGSGRILQPGQQQVGLQCIEGPLASPGTMIVSGANGPQMIMFGGVHTRVELASRMIGHMEVASNGADAKGLARRALELADALLELDAEQRAGERG